MQDREDDLDGKLAGKVAVVVGATSGMGWSTALSLAREGASLVVSGRRHQLLQELAEQIVRETGRTAVAIPCDTQIREQVDSLLTATVAQFGRYDILIYATGVNHPERAMDRLSVETWDWMINTNLHGAFHLTHLALPQLRKQGGGLIIYISSIAARRADTVSGVAYQAGKRALDGLAFGTAAEEKDHGIRTCVIYPGLCDTPLVLQRPSPTPPEVLAQALQPEDVAEACLFVATLPERCTVPELVLMPSRL